MTAGRALKDGKGVLVDGTQFDRQSGEEHGPNGYWFRWHRLKGKSGKVHSIVITAKCHAIYWFRQHHPRARVARYTAMFPVQRPVYHIASKWSQSK